MTAKGPVKIIIYFLISCLTIIAISNPASAKVLASEGPETSAKFLDEFFVKEMLEHNVPGAALVVVKDGQIVFSKGYGYANLEKYMPIDPKETIFRVASVSKIFTITGILQLEEQGLVDIDEDVNRYLKKFKVENNFDEPIRIRHLLTHTDGFETRDLATFVDESSKLQSLEELLMRDLKSPVQKPGSLITYGGYGTALAGYLITQIKDTSFENYMENNVFRPLKMESSTFDQVLSDDLKEKVVTIYSYGKDSKEYIPTQFLYVRTPPTGALSTTAEDMGKFIIALLNKGEYEGNRILKENTVNKILNRQYSPHLSLPGVTYGFMESFFNGHRGLVRDGSGVGVRSQIFLLPEYNMGYFYVQNTRGDEMVEKFNETFIEKFLPNNSTVLKNQKDTKNIKRYEGIYRTAQTAEHTIAKMEALAIGDLRVKASNDGELVVSILGEEEVYGGFSNESEWIEIEPLLFRRTDKEQYMAFQENEKGEIISLTSGSGYHGSFIKIPWYESNKFQLYLLVLNIIILIIATTINLARLLRGNRDRLQISGLISLLYIIAIPGTLYALFFRRVAGFPAFAFGVSKFAKMMITVLLISSSLSIAFLILFIKSWISNKMTIFDKVFYSITIVSLFSTMLWLRYWNLLGYKY